MKSTPSKEPVRIGKCRASFFTFATLALGIICLGLVEVTLTWFDVGNPDVLPDPFVGFRDTRPLFSLNAEGTEFEIASSRRTFFNYDSFPSSKPENEYRIFCLGGSTVAGRPYGIETSFTRWLELGLGAAAPSRAWRVVNCGGISYASYRLLPIFQEILDYEPDLVVVMTGHNEFLEDRSYGHLKEMPEVVARPYEWMTRTRIFTLLRSAFTTTAPTKGTWETADRTAASTEVRAILDFKGGLAKYHRDEYRRRAVIENFASNLSSLVHRARRSEVPILLVNPGCNLRDIPPFKSEHREGMTLSELSDWNALREEARVHSRSEPLRGVEALKKAIEVDALHAATYYRKGLLYDSVGMLDRALESYEKSKELDVCPVRILEAMNETIVEIVRKEALPWVDARSLLIDRSRDRIPGDDVYLDHVHPTIQSHQTIADALLERMREMGIVEPQRDWRERRDTAYSNHLESLDAVYYAKGLIRLEKLRDWATGRSDIEPPAGSP